MNTEDSKRMQKLTEAARDDNITMKALTEAAVSDSAAMKQIACVLLAVFSGLHIDGLRSHYRYLSMIFLPASFVAVSFI